MMVLVFIALLLLSFAVNWTLLKKLKQWGTQEYRAQVRWSAQAKPTIGGVSFLVGFFAALGWVAFTNLSPPKEIYSVVLLVFAAGIAFAMGLADDIWHTRPGSKFFFQTLCGMLLVLSGFEFDIGLHPAVQAAITLLWVITLMNSVNMLDNMDGVSGAAAFAVLIALGMLDPLGAAGFVAWAMAATLGGFLLLNVHPSKLFMGDAGSQLLGFLLAALSLIIFRIDGELGAVQSSNLRWVLLPLLFFTTLCDTALVTLNRLLHGRSPFVGGRDHSTHNLSYLGWSDQRIGIFYAMWSGLNASMVCFLLKVPVKNGVGMLFGVAAYMLLIFILFFLISRYNMKRNKYAYTP